MPQWAEMTKNSINYILSCPESTKKCVINFLKICLYFAAHSGWSPNRRLGQRAVRLDVRGQPTGHDQSAAGVRIFQRGPSTKNLNHSRSGLQAKKAKGQPHRIPRNRRK